VIFLFKQIDRGVYVISRREALSRKYREIKSGNSHFYRDRERILDCPVYRALEDKTQVSRIGYYDCGDTALMPTI